MRGKFIKVKVGHNISSCKPEAPQERLPGFNQVGTGYTVIESRSMLPQRTFDTRLINYIIMFSVQCNW